jgi:hypothetical protein
MIQSNGSISHSSKNNTKHYSLFALPTRHEIMTDDGSKKERERRWCNGQQHHPRGTTSFHYVIPHSEKVEASFEHDPAVLKDTQKAVGLWREFSRDGRAFRC